MGECAAQVPALRRSLISRWLVRPGHGRDATAVARYERARPGGGKISTVETSGAGEERSWLPTSNLEPAAGRLLVAAPMLVESTFARSVVYLLEHDGGGTVGVVLNQPSHTPVGQVLPDWYEAVSEPQVIFTGGPVQPDGALCLGLTEGVMAEALVDSGRMRPLTGGICTVDLDGDVDQITAVTTRMRVFAGHSGWGRGQVGDEIAEGAWYVVEGSVADVFADEPLQLWPRVLRRQPAPLCFVATYPREISQN
jgi:putative transcriptional regulator